jgi:hypothetical protein
MADLVVGDVLRDFRVAVVLPGKRFNRAGVFLENDQEIAVDPLIGIKTN